MNRSLLLVVAILLAVAATPVQAHYHILHPSLHSVKVGDQITFSYGFGHPFEHQLFQTEKPERATLFAPDGKATDVLAKFEKFSVEVAGGKQVSAYRFVFQPEGRGDYTLVVESPPIWMQDEKHFVRDTSRVVLHVETQKGWDARAAGANEFAIAPLTRPYGLRAGTVFQASVHPNEANGVAHLVEIERYNPEAPRALPPDEHITHAVKTDPNGTATCTLPDPGWWCVTAIRRYPAEAKPPTRERDAKQYPVVERATLWVRVDDQVPLKPVE
jgi:cobalt/nickel transport protein